MKLSTNFDSDEFGCKCCGQVHPDGMDPKLISLLENIRAQACEILGADAPVTIISGYRCLRHNKAVKGARSSQHLLGTAADIVISGLTPKAVAQIAQKILGRSGGIGVYSGFTHVDVRRNRARW